MNFGLLAAEIVLGVWGTPATFNGFRVLAALLHGSQVVIVSQTLRHWTEGATYVRQGNNHVGHWPTFLVQLEFINTRTTYSIDFVVTVHFFHIYLVTPDLIVPVTQSMASKQLLCPVIMAALVSRCGHSILPLSFLSFFLACSQLLQIGCLPYFHTWCGLSANLECRSEMCCTRLAENTGRQKSSKFAICAPSHNFVGLYLRS